jgi:hypothetical protein
LLVSIPINFKYNLKNINNSSIDLFIIFSNKEINLENDLFFLNSTNENNKFFYIQLKLNKKYIFVSNSFDSKILKKKIKSKKIYRFDILLENNYNMLLITENLLNIFEEKYLCPFHFDDNNDYYLSLYVKSNENLIKEDYLELNFE